MRNKSYGYAEKFRKEKLGKTIHKQAMPNIGHVGDAGLQTPLGGSHEPSLARKLNPTVLDYVRLHGSPWAMPWDYGLTRGDYMAPVSYGHDQSLNADMQRRVPSLPPLAESYNDRASMIGHHQTPVSSTMPSPSLPPPAPSMNDRSRVLSQHQAPVSSSPPGYGGTTPGSVPVDPQSIKAVSMLMNFLNGRR
jgi:hypothetical protein